LYRVAAEGVYAPPAAFCRAINRLAKDRPVLVDGLRAYKTGRWRKDATPRGPELIERKTFGRGGMNTVEQLERAGEGLSPVYARRFWRWMRSLARRWGGSAK
jgi:hypothetical protein